MNTSEISSRSLEQLSPFELKNKLIDMADSSVKSMAVTMLNAGRGNPNWVATTPREAFFAIGTFAMQECRLAFSLPDGIAGMPQKQGIAARFERFLIQNSAMRGVEFLKKAYNYMLMRHAADPDELVFEWTDGVVGDQYPTPDRILKFTEIAVNDYLCHELCNNCPTAAPLQLFATEGGTAAICYIFDSLMQNRLLRQGDAIAILVPTFTPYIEIPRLDRFNFEILHIPASMMTADGRHRWQYDDADIDRLRDPKYKALVIINPSNPPSYALEPHTIERLADIVHSSNPDLMIISDDVYATFVPHFQSVLAALPQNVIGVYSFSKYFGATGWRAAVIAMCADNVFDSLISRLPQACKKRLHKRYETISTDPDSIKFIDRMVADSRQVALNHTAGLSLPQQIQMSLFALFSLVDDGDGYRRSVLSLIDSRLNALWDSAGFALVPDPLRAGYYSEIDMLVWAEKFYGDDFVLYLKEHFSPLDIVFRLASETGLVVLNGGGFDGPQWSVRVSLANLNEPDYRRIGAAIRQILTEYADSWRQSETLSSK